MLSHEVGWLKSKWNDVGTCKIDNYFSKLDADMQSVIDKCERIEKQLNEEVKTLTEEVAAYKRYAAPVAETLPDMMWCKDLEEVNTYMLIKQL